MSKEHQAEQEWRCDQAQLEMLERCAEKGCMKEWNDCRRACPFEQVWLQGADLRGRHLDKANLMSARLDGANLSRAHLDGAGLLRADLSSARLDNAFLQGADFTEAIVDGKTLITGRRVNKDTFFSTVGLDAARVEPGLKQTLQYNIRRKRWEGWYGEHRCFGPAVKVFWLMSDYGRSTWRIILTFFLLAAVFGVHYWAKPGCLHGPGLEEVAAFAWYRQLAYAVYFSVVTMTTLGFGDIHANPASLWGQFILSVQVILGYVLLGALVTRFAVLFTAGGPAAPFPGEVPWWQWPLRALRAASRFAGRLLRGLRRSGH